jgi:hypothetical protein
MTFLFRARMPHTLDGLRVLLVGQKYHAFRSFIAWQIPCPIQAPLPYPSCCHVKRIATKETMVERCLSADR